MNEAGALSSFIPIKAFHIDPFSFSFSFAYQSIVFFPSLSLSFSISFFYLQCLPLRQPRMT